MNDEELALRIEVHGTPIKASVRPTGPRAMAWAQRLLLACEEAAQEAGEAKVERIGGIGDAEGGRGVGRLPRGVKVDMEFRFAVPAGKTAWSGRPHGLAPKVEDLASDVIAAMTAAGLLTDDGRVAEIRARKIWSSKGAGLSVVFKRLSSSDMLVENDDRKQSDEADRHQ